MKLSFEFKTMLIFINLDNFSNGMFHLLNYPNWPSSDFKSITKCTQPPALFSRQVFHLLF